MAWFFFFTKRGVIASLLTRIIASKIELLCFKCSFVTEMKVRAGD